MKSIKYIFLSFFLVFTFSCKKKRVANRLEGIWNVDKLTNGSGIYTNPGTYQFKENGDVVYNMDYVDIVSGIHNKFTITTKWVNTKNTVTIGNVNSGTAQNTYIIEELTKSKMKLDTKGNNAVILEMTKK